MMNCPYCKTTVNENKNAVNGITPIHGEKGCEFCNPTPRVGYDNVAFMYKGKRLVMTVCARDGDNPNILTVGNGLGPDYEVPSHLCTVTTERCTEFID